VLVAGDWHGNREWAARCFHKAADLRCPVILQLGDFGVWPGRADAWLDHCDGLGRDTGVSLVWIDGNHEDHDALDVWKEKADPSGLVPMRDTVTWASRGARWSWSGVRFGALGGAVSADRFLRRAGVNWWPQEAPTQADADRLGDGRLDVLVTHAAPARVPFSPTRPLRLPGTILEDARQVRNVLDRAVERTRPRLVLHGHYHHRYRVELPDVVVEGLAHDKSTGSDGYAVLSLAALSLLDP
jgi:hypothetical protein